MRRTQLIMGMPVVVEVMGANKLDLNEVFDYFRRVDERFSTYKPTSEISQINRGLSKDQWSDDMKEVLSLCEQTKWATGGFFNIEHNGQLDPSGLVKGWAVQAAAKLLQSRGFKNFYIEAGGDIQLAGRNKAGEAWQIGIRNPFNRQEVVKVLRLSNNEGVATSGTYIRGQHVYNPHQPGQTLTDTKSLTVVGSNIYDADRFATAAFAMGARGLEFIESLTGFEAYLIDSKQLATYTSGFEGYVL